MLASHFDAWQQPLGASSLDHLGAEARADLAHYPDEIHACAPATRVIVPEHFVAIPL